MIERLAKFYKLDCLGFFNGTALGLECQSGILFWIKCLPWEEPSARYSYKLAKGGASSMTGKICPKVQSSSPPSLKSRLNFRVCESCNVPQILEKASHSICKLASVLSIAFAIPIYFCSPPIEWTNKSPGKRAVPEKVIELADMPSFS